MNIPDWSRPGLYGAVAGAALLAVNGFSWGGWVTGSKAQEMAAVAAVAALVPICIEQSRQDPKVNETLAMLKETSSYKRSDMVMDAGWATMPGSEDPNRSVASACMEQLAAQF